MLNILISDFTAKTVTEISLKITIYKVAVASYRMNSLDNNGDPTHKMQFLPMPVMESVLRPSFSPLHGSHTQGKAQHMYDHWDELQSVLHCKTIKAKHNITV